jgi:hypothetical protein
MAGENIACPQCGAEVAIPIPVGRIQRLVPDAEPTPAAAPLTTPPPSRKTNSLAITGLVMGILSIVPGFLCGVPIFALLGVIFSGVAMSQINRQPLEQEGKGMAVAGLVVSLVGLALNVIAMVVVALLMAGCAGLMSAMAKTMHL